MCLPFQHGAEVELKNIFARRKTVFSIRHRDYYNVTVVLTGAHVDIFRDDSANCKLHHFNEVNMDNVITTEFNSSRFNITVSWVRLNTKS